MAGRIKQILDEEVYSIRFHDRAEQYEVAEVNSKWIFRFIRDSADSTIVREQAFLPQFAALTPLPIPRIVFFDADFIAYRKIAGEHLTAEALNQLSTDSQSVIAGQLASFLRAMHAFPLEKAEVIGRRDSWGGWRTEAHEIFGRDVVPLLQEGSRDLICSGRLLPA